MTNPAEVLFTTTLTFFGLKKRFIAFAIFEMRVMFFASELRAQERLLPDQHDQTGPSYPDPVGRSSTEQGESVHLPEENSSTAVVTSSIITLDPVSSVREGLTTLDQKIILSLIHI